MGSKRSTISRDSTTAGRRSDGGISTISLRSRAWTRWRSQPQPRRPVFVFFPTITTHAPFTPAPPYQQDWTRVLTTNPYDKADLDRAWSEQPDWLNLGPSYVQSLIYTHATLGGYLRLRADRDFILILIGDHQPPALVSGPNASWDVPVHVIAGRTALLDRLRQHGFRDGLAPSHPAAARMDTLLPILLDAFGDPEEKSVSSAPATAPLR